MTTGLILLGVVLVVGLLDVALWVFNKPTFSELMINLSWRYTFPIVWLTGCAVGFFCGHFLWPLCGRP